MPFSIHKLYRKKNGSTELFLICSGSPYKCKSELFDCLCKDANCPHEIKTWRFLKNFCKKYDIHLYISQMHDYATFENWIYFID